MKLNNYKLDIQKSILFVSLLLLTLHIPLIFTIYTPIWYQFNYNIQDTYNQIEKQTALNATNNLIGFFLYQNELNENWNQKELIHMSDVRKIYLIVHIIALLSILTTYLLYNKKLISKYSKINIKAILTLIIIIPFFQIFWNTIFHPILFSNNYWIITPQDISFYLFPLGFFIRCFILIITLAITLNYLIHYKLSKLQN